MYSVKRYEKTDSARWDALVKQSRNGTFLFERAYMDYHKDRFEDHSLLVFEDGKLVALLPANLEKDGLYSHWGLSYGGFIYGIGVKLPNFLGIFQATLSYLHQNDIQALSIKEIPEIYHQVPSDEISYALFLAEAELTRCDTLSVIDKSNPLPVASNRMSGVKKAVSLGIQLIESDKLDEFWNQLLIPNLAARHAASPVHSLEEMQLLKSRFPDKIRYFSALQEGKPVAGCIVFETETTAHMQYISADENRSEHGALDFLHYQLIMETFSGKRYFDFGTSNTNQGLNLNEGLLFWKESFGARTITQRFYKVDTSKHERFKTVLL
ncbi:GNAT family N-acetyltransferase [Flavobacterium sp. SE-s28]|uniref:GNAT family N-acetyltransferase n=1 Tax=Flavobacterium silvaticum TaxID=1852020 RepID=A0A972FIM4_9FLAO|nr:GNAT family N-acetyltransferase [Flavobacterium silvaticum]